MIKKVSALFLACAFLLNGAGMVFANPEKTARQTAPLAQLLPASDGIVIVNMRRVLNEALPQVLSANTTMLNDILGKFDQIKTETGIDLRQFEQVAVGVSAKKISAKDTTFEPIILARGTFNVGAVLGLAKVAAKGKYREETIGGKTAYIFSPKQVAAQGKAQLGGSKNSMFESSLDKMLSGLSEEIAVTNYDNNTLVIGSPLRVRETFSAKSHIGADVLSLANRKPNSILSFGVKLPNGLAQFIDLDNDEIGKNLESIRQISGSIDVGGGSASVSLIAKTLDAAQAKNLQETLSGLQMIGKAFIGGAKGADKQVYARMIDNAKITLSGMEVMLDLQVAQSDIDTLIGAK